MSDRLPPLTALRAFEAAARHMSFARAADELNVTPAALSFQIKSLEEHLGQPVFRRLNRAVALTEAGRTLAPGVADGFFALTQAWTAARRLGTTRSLTVTAGPSFTSRWLAPRLYAFAQAHPGIDLRFTATVRLLDFNRDEVDVAIRFGEAAPQGLFSRSLMRDWVTPMMTPELAESIQQPEDLRQATLLHQDDIAFLRHPTDWGAWFRAAGLGPAPTAGPHLSQADHAMDAAVSGAGVILGRVAYAGRELRSGQLIAPFRLAIAVEAEYRVVCAEGTERRPQIAAFLDWIDTAITEEALFDDSWQVIRASEVPDA